MRGSDKIKSPKNYNDFLTRFGHKSTEYKIVSFTSSVITERARFNYFKDMIQSVCKQEIYPDLFFLSIHISPDLNIPDKEFTDMFKEVPFEYHILRQKRPKKQFVQYKEMLSHLGQHFDLKKTWIMFSDDDDLWNTMRTKVFYAAINSYKTMTLKPEEKFVGVCILESIKQKDSMIPCCEIHTPSDVITAIYDGLVDVTMHQGIRVEHHEYLVKTCMLTNFLDKNKFLVKTNRYCDLDFRQFLIKSKDSLSCDFLPIPVKNWLYFYRASCGEYTQVSSEFLYNDKVKDTNGILLQNVDMAMTKSLKHKVEDRLQQYMTYMKFDLKQKEDFMCQYKQLLDEQIENKKKFESGNNKKQKI